MALKKKRIELLQGETFFCSLYLYQGDDVVVPITAASLDYPCLVTAAAHGLPMTSAVPVSLIGPVSWLTTTSLKESDRIYATAISSTQFTVPIDTTAEAAYVPGNTLIYTPPVNLTGWTGRMQARSSVGSSVVLFECTTENGGMNLGADGAIELFVADTVTDALNFTSAIGDVEVESPGGSTTRVARLLFRLNKQTTRAA